MTWALAAFVGLPSVASHGWITTPVSRLEMAYQHFSTGMPDDLLRWSPQSCNGPNSCGAWDSDFTDSKEKWLKFYGLAGVGVPVWAPGTDVETQIKITADHGGQSWLMLSCADTITETGPWTYLERAADDRDHHYLPSSPHVYAWPEGEIVHKYNSILKARWTVPSNFSCPVGLGVGRWVWKTGNTCNDNLNVNTKRTETFVLAEFKKINDAFSQMTMPTCHGGGFQNEYFITCFDFSNSTAPAPTPAPIPSASAKCCWSKWGPLDGCGNYPSDAHGACCNTNWGHKCEQDDDCKDAPPSPPPAPTPVRNSLTAPKCCWGKWGDEDTCGSYPSGASGARCNTDPTKTCQSDGDCNPAPPPHPTPTPPKPTPTPPPGPSPPSPSPIAPSGDVEGCHEAAKAFCDNGHNFCRACQGYGTWGDMFFVVECNDGTIACNIKNSKGDVCQCQQKGGCKAGSATCPGPATDGLLI